MKKIMGKALAILFAAILGCSVAQTGVFALETEERIQTEQVGSEPKLAGGSYAKGQTVSGTFPAVSGMDIATVRYYKDAAKTDYGFAALTKNDQNYSYQFKAPYDGFSAVQASSEDLSETATVIAEYYSLTRWDGAVDVSWYDEDSKDFYLTDPAQLAGFAAIVNGSVDGGIEDYQVKGVRSTPDDRSKNRGLPDVIEAKYEEKMDLIAGVRDEAWKGVAKHDFADRTVHIMSDMDMGGVPGDQIDHQRNVTAEANAYAGEYPNWTPIGGEYLMDPADSSSMIVAFFNGTIEGHGHSIDNLYCFRWSYKTVGDTAYGYAQGTGFVGMMGSLYKDGDETEAEPKNPPSIRNLSLSGYIYGRRMVAGFAGCLGGGLNAAAGTSVAGGLSFENLANHAYIYCTDSKGLGGILGCSMTKGSLINCYNTGSLNAYYPAPTGGIIGSNEKMDLFCCYNRGKISTHGNDYGRGIGGNNNGSGYTVDNCYYLEGPEYTDCKDYPGYYTYLLTPGISVNVTEMTETQMKDGTLLNALNVNGTAYVEGADGWPVLYRENESREGSLTLVQTEGGEIKAAKSGALDNGTVVYLTNTPENGYRFRYYTLNGRRLSGPYVTVNGDGQVSAVFESAKAGVLTIEPNSVCTVSVTKNGTVIDKNGQAKTVKNYPVHSGDPIYEGDRLIVDAKINEGAVPDDESLQYSATTNLVSAFRFHYTYTGGVTKSTVVKTFTVDESINGEDASLTLEVEPLTTQKLWSYTADTSWYQADQTVFTLHTARELAGLIVLVGEGNTFDGKTIRLGCDLSLKNDDGTGGRRIWDGIGENIRSSYFAGTFDGQGHKITDLSAADSGLFKFFGKYPSGTDAPETKAVLKNLTVYGTASGVDASGLVSRAKHTEITNCKAFVDVKATSGCSGGIAGYAQEGCSIEGCISYGKICSKGRVGGLVGELSAGSTLTDCINRGGVTCPDSGGNNVGGLVGSLSGEVLRSANYGDVLAYGRTIGGIAGQSVSQKAKITDCYNVGSVTYEKGSVNTDCLGGLIGFGSYYQIENSFNYGTVEAKDPLSGGLIGGLIGKNGKKSTSITKNTYYLDSSCSFADSGLTVSELPETVYCAGMKQASAEEFQSASGVLSAINERGSFALTNHRYPEHSAMPVLHVHKGGTATCSSHRICTECGLAYGVYDPENHTDVILKGKRDAVWATDGYTGDRVCRDCGAVVEQGTDIPADTSKEVLKVEYQRNGVVVKSVTYSIAELEAMKSTEPIAYSYGPKSKEIMVAKEYVTLERLLHASGYGFGNAAKIKVVCDSSASEIEMDELKECCRYYDKKGTVSAAPAAFCFHYTSFPGSFTEVLPESKPNDAIRFGYGISEKQYKEETDVGGKRMVSPVRSVTVFLKEDILLDAADYHCLHQYKTDGKNAICEVPEKAATCTESGYDAHFACAGCGACFLDENGNQPVAEKDITRPRIPHALTHTEAKAATCLEKGNIEYWTCKTCGKRFTDTQGTKEIDEEKTETPIGIHTRGAVQVENEVAATCQKNGSYENVIYCTVCKEEISRVKRSTAKLSHVMTAVAAKAPTTQKEGNIAYFKCSSCNKLYLDRNGMREVSPNSVILAKLKLKPVIKAAPKKVKQKTLKKKKQVLKGVITVKNAYGSVTYKKVSGSKCLLLNKKTGAVTVKKGTKKGTYYITVKVTVKETAKNTALTKTLKKIKIRVK